MQQLLSHPDFDSSACQDPHQVFSKDGIDAYHRCAREESNKYSNNFGHRPVATCMLVQDKNLDECDIVQNAEKLGRISEAGKRPSPPELHALIELGRRQTTDELNRLESTECKMSKKN